jgi:hypothetical protein
LTEKIVEFNLVATLKVVALSSIKFYFSVAVLMIPICLLLYWPDETPFSFLLVFEVLKGLIIHPVFYAGLGVIFIGFFVIAIADRWVTK